MNSRQHPTHASGRTPTPTALALVSAFLLAVGACDAGQDGRAGDGGPPGAGHEAAGSPGEAGPDGAAGASADAGSADAVVFRRHTVPLPGQPGTPALTLLVPEGWTVEGGMQRTPPALRSMFALTDILVEAPDGRSFHYYPALAFNYSDYTQARPMQPVNGAYFLPPPRSMGEWILDMARMNPEPGVRDLQLVSQEPLPDLTRQMQRMHGAQLQELRQMAVAQGGQTFGDVGGSRVVFRYDEDGRALEETFLVGWRVMGMNTYGQVAMASWGVSDMRSIAGPAGSDYLNDPALITIAQSLRFTPQYHQAMYRHYQAISPRTPPKTVAQLRQDGQSVNDILYDGWKKRSGMTDAGQSRVVDMIHERTPYPSPDGGTVYLSSHYNRVFSDGQDRYVLTNDANWDPRTDPGFRDRSWEALRPQR